MDEWFEGDWLASATEWVEGAAAVVSAALGGHKKGKGFKSFASKIVTDKEKINHLIAAAKAKAAEEEESKRLRQELDKEWMLREHYRELGKMSASKRRLERIAEEQRQLETEKNLSTGRDIRQQNIRMRANTIQMSEVERVVEKRRQGKAWHARMERAKRHR